MVNRFRGALLTLAIFGMIAGGLAFSLDWPLDRVQGSLLEGTPSPPPAPTGMPSTSAADTRESANLAVFALRDGRFSHLYAFDPLLMPARYVRLSSGNWDDIHPALSPDGRSIAYASRRNGYWDIYQMELSTGAITRLTDTPAYDGHPSWSPDGSQLVYESMVESNLEIMLLEPSAPVMSPVRLTYRPEADHTPAWSPHDQRIAFISSGTSGSNVLMANLADDELSFQNISGMLPGQKTNLAWSPDGSQIAWSSDVSGSWLISCLNFASGEIHTTAAGAAFDWDPTGSILLSEMPSPNNYQLARSRSSDGQLTVPLAQLPGALRGIDWSIVPSDTNLSPSFETLASLPTTDGTMDGESRQEASFNRPDLVRLTNVDAPYPYLLDSVAGSFNQLRSAAAEEAGWDVFGSLEQAYRPLSAPGDPSKHDDWLMTGRAFSANTLPMPAGWMVVQMERYSGQVYWRVFVKTTHQDGSQGEPLHGLVWNLDARNSGQPAAFEQGGKWEQAPGGYWVDVTSLAIHFGWQRLPALQNWRTYYQAARFNQWVQPGPLSWRAAMAELYPPEAIENPTAIPTFDPTLSAGGKPNAALQPTPTFQPTWTLSVPAQDGG